MSYELMFQKAINLHQNGALNEAEQIYRQILETAPQNADVLNLLGLIAQTKGIHNEAISYFYKATEFAPQHFPIFFNLAVSLEALNKHLEAIEAYGKVLKIKSDCKEAFLGLGNIYWQIGKKADAKHNFEKAISVDKNYIEALINLADLEDNEQKLQELSIKFSQSALPFYYLGRRDFAKNDFAKASNNLDKADKLTSSDEIKTLLGLSLLAQQKPDEAITYFYQAVQLNCHNTTAMVNIADYETKQNNFKDAEKYYKRTIELEPQNLQAHSNYANMLCKNKRTLEALEEYRQAIILSPDTPALSYNLAIILKTLEDYEQALALMFNAYYKDTSHIDWSLNIVETLILFNAKEPEKAQKIAQNWLQKMPQNIVAQHIKAVLNGQPSAVEQEYNQLLFNNFAPTYEQTLQNIHYQVVENIKNLKSVWSGKILDLGCGSGLMAQAIHNQNTQFYGVDIANKMLELAKQKNIYDKLYNQDIADFLNKSPFSSDFIIIAADVFCYFGDLESIISKCFPHELIFSVETGLNTENYHIQANGRYQHNPLYIENILQKCGYTKISKHNLVLRQENGNNVLGFIFQAEK